MTDHLGTPRELLSEKVEVEWAASYRLWGSVRALRAKRRVNGGSAWEDEPEQEDAQVCPLRFLGQWADEETGLYYNRHRHYDPLVGQYASPDPIGLEGGDRPQGYVARPGRWSDPLGLKVFWGTWDDYPKVTVNTPNGPQQFAQIGDHLYSEHAVARMQPNGQRYSSGPGSDYVGTKHWSNEPYFLVKDGNNWVRGGRVITIMTSN